MAKFTNRQKAAEAAREVAMRVRVYGSGHRANILGANLTKLLLMEEMCADYTALADADEKKDRLF